MPCLASNTLILLRAPAKLNLGLNLMYPREDGYHELQSVMLRLPGLADTMEITSRSSSESNLGLTLTCNQAGLAGPDNLLHKAYDHFYKTCPQLSQLTIYLHLEKNIPVQAGLGGGSSDAATLLAWLNRTHQDPLNEDELLSLGATLGSDIPFFLLDVPLAWVSGRGEQVSPLPRPLIEHVATPSDRKDDADKDAFFQEPVVPDDWLARWLIIKPVTVGMPTRLAYQRIRERACYQVQSFNQLVRALHQQDVTALEQAMWNDFEPVVLDALPEVREVTLRMRALGIRRPLLCGSGSAVAGLLPAGFSMLAAELAECFPPREFEVLQTVLA